MERDVHPGWGWFIVLASALLWWLISGAVAHAGALTSCSQTVGASAAAVPFPNNPQPTTYLEICNAHAANTLGVNFSGGTASIGAAGTLTLAPGGCMWWNATDIPNSLSVIGSAGSTPTACGYR